jgi:nitroreductase
MALPHPKHAPADHEILDVIRERWSPRAFDASRELPPAELHRLFEAARWAPSSSNEQPWRFVVMDRRRTPEDFAALHAALTRSNQTWASSAPVLILVAVNLLLTRTGGLNRSAWYDTGQAVGFLTLQATAIGVAIRQMEGFDHDRAREACGVPESFEPGVVMAVGYPGDPDLLVTENHRVAERQPRSRQPIEEFVFEGRWGTTIRKPDPQSP